MPEAQRGDVTALGTTGSGAAGLYTQQSGSEPVPVTSPHTPKSMPKARRAGPRLFRHPSRLEDCWVRPPGLRSKQKELESCALLSCVSKADNGGPRQSVELGKTIIRRRKKKSLPHFTDKHLLWEDEALKCQNHSKAPRCVVAGGLGKLS